MLNQILSSEFQELQRRTQTVFANHGFGERLNPYVFSQVKQFLVDQKLLFLNDLPTISKYTQQVWQLLLAGSPSPFNVNLWELPRESREIAMLATSSSVIDELLRAENSSTLSRTDIDSTIETDFQRLSKAISQGVNMKEVSSILSSLCGSFGRKAMCQFAQTAGLGALKAQLRNHKLSPDGGALGEFSAAYIGHMQSPSSLRDDTCFSDSLSKVLAYYKPYQTFYLAAQRGTSRELSI